MDTVEERRARWQQICQEYHERGETLKQFCESRGIARSTLGYWLNPAKDKSHSYQSKKSAVPIWFR
jgi:transposase-like protein